ncbi:hypothetical protein [Halalkalibacter hemicellulosilyticus]|uniref:Uncharacterized protein n=1 Tax=Halalkalibacter hemicellulosilyticusJCM 9152 TaxID=1236971 RepID=W4QGG5_9BACI|nr:hypothetical protein [Halalkalibacter hemicellulosilyticus]GAE30748.1 hypothetical protein JCM9152_2164 [Halalkalibacter hemicellulosilyticusJCM 9152]
MLNSNKTVLILPILLMVIMFVGGYYFLNGVESITNEQLEDHIDFDIEYTAQETSIVINGEWNWNVMPSEGLYGNDYIGVSVSNDQLNYTNAILELTYGDQVIEQIEGVDVENGIIFVFPNELVEQVSYGNSGRFQIELEHNEIVDKELNVHYLHTWTNHVPMDLEDAAFESPTFGEALEVPYWMISRKVNGEQMINQ